MELCIVYSWVSFVYYVSAVYHCVFLGVLRLLCKRGLSLFIYYTCDVNYDGINAVLPLYTFF